MRKQSNRRWTIDLILITVITIVVAGTIFGLPFTGSLDRSRCLNNLKECVLALHTYWNDYDACLPASGVSTGSRQWNKAACERFATREGVLPPPAGESLTWSQVLYDSMKNKDIMFCPLDRSNHNNPTSQVSYWWKCAMDKAWFGVNGVKRNKESDYGYQADQVFLYEHNSWHGDPTNGLRNGAKINVAYMDGHVHAITLQNATSGDAVNCSANSDGEPMYYNWDASKDTSATNPLAANVPAKYIDPAKCADRF